jgi:hypothetical protein
MVVYSPDEGRFAEAAAYVADARSEDLVTDLDDIGDGTVVYVSRPDAIDEPTLLALQQRHLDSGGHDDFSVVTGYTPEMARALYDRRYDEDGDHLLLSRKGTTHEIPDDVLVLQENETTVEQLRGLVDDGLTSLSLVSSGRGIHLYLKEGYVCGFPSSQNVADYDARQPYCVEDGEKSCPFDEELLSAEELDAGHLFLSSCASMIDNSNSGLPVHVGMSLLDGAETLIGSYRVAPVAVHEPVLHYSLLRAGYDLTERCRLLNLNAHTNHIKSYGYVPFGRPESAISAAPSATPRVEVETGAETAELTVSDPDGYVVDVRVPEDAVPGDGDRLYVRETAESAHDDALYYATFRDGDEHRLLLYNGGRIDAERIHLEAGYEPSRHDEQAIAEATMRNARAIDDLGILDQNAQNYLTNLRHHVLNLPNPRARERFDANAYRAAADELDTVTTTVTNLQTAIRNLLREGDFLYEKYQTRAESVAVYPTEEGCDNCGRPTFIREIADVTGEVRRAIGACPECALRFDVPTTPGDRSPPRPVTRGDLVECDEEAQPLAVEFTNPTDRPMTATFFPKLDLFDYDEDGNMGHFTPELVERRLEPGERTTVEFTINTELLAPNTYNVYVHVVANGEIHVGMDVMLLGEKGGYNPAQ